MIAPALALTFAFALAPTTQENANMTTTDLYFETHGDGDGVPLVLIHGSFMTIGNTWPALLPALAKDRRVIAVELRGHGHSADVDGAFSYAALADDVAAAIRKAAPNTKVDVLGYSLGGVVGAGVALRHPELVRKLVIMSSAMNQEGWEPAALEGLRSLPKEFAPPPLVDAYNQVAPDKSRWPALVAKVKALILDAPGWSDEQMKSLAQPTLFLMGDRDGFRTEKSLALSRSMKNAQLAVVPGADHFFPFTRADLVVPIVTAFLRAP